MYYSIEVESTNDFIMQLCIDSAAEKINERKETSGSYNCIKTFSIYGSVIMFNMEHILLQKFSIKARISRVTGESEYKIVTYNEDDYLKLMAMIG